MNHLLKSCLLVLLFSPLSALAQSKQITSAEYFWDTDPSAGSGNALTVLDGNFDEAIETVFENTSSLPSEGNHVLKIRVLDVNGAWSAPFSTVIFIDESTTEQRNIKITSAEYFWDTDPGAGSGNALLAFDGNFDEAIETIFTNTSSLPSEGNHILNIRMRDAENLWSSLFSTVIFIDEATTEQRQIKITAGEMFWDNDPGQGNGIGLLAFDAEFNEAIEQALKCTTALPSAGLHKLCMRMRDAEYQWSPLFCTMIVIDESVTAQREITITAGEYFWDADPGEGSATAMIVFDGNFNEAIESITASQAISMATGPHVLNIRMRDAGGVWSNEFRVIIVVEEQTEEQRNIYLASAEYWFDTDPGAGSATPIVCMDGNFNEAIEGIIGGAIPSPVTSGMHSLWFRAKDPQGGWGPKFGIVVDMDINVTTFGTAISGTTNICSGIEQIGQNYYALAATGSTYAWSIAGGIITSGQGTPHIVVNWNSGATQIVTLQQCLNDVCQEATMDVDLLQPVATTVNVSVCNGESYFAANAFRTEAGTYVDEMQTTHGCDSTVTTILTVLPHSTHTVYQSICAGESLLVGGALQTTSGIYLDILNAANGCDSLRYTVLTVHPTYNHNVVVEICPGNSYFVGGANQTTSGFYSDLFQSIYGCDSLVVTHLIVNSTIHTYEYVDICGGDSYFAGGANQTVSGTYVETFPGVCTEIRTTYLTVNPSYNINNIVEIFTGQNYYAGGAWQTESGVYVDAYQTTLGCDSIITTNLTVTVVVNHTQYIDICEGENFYAGGALQTASGIFVDVITGACTETLTTYLNVHPYYNDVDNVVICLGQSYYTGGAEQTTSGVYYDSYQTPFGCDSLITTNLTVVNSIDSEQTIELCEGDSVFLSGEWQTTSGVYVDVTNAAQCVEVLTTTLIVFPEMEVSNNVTICTGQSYYAGGALQTISGIYVDVFQSQFGCDSTVTTTLDVISNLDAPTVIDLGDGFVTSSEIADEYLWTIDGLGCDILMIQTALSSVDVKLYCESDAYLVSLQTLVGGCQSPLSDEVTIILADCTQTNDDCSGAFTLAVDGPNVIDSNQCATNFGEDEGSCSNDIGRSVWYKFTADDGGSYDIHLDNVVPISTEFNPKLEVFYGACNNLSQLACVNVNGNNASEMVSLDDLNAGSYFIRVSGFLIQSGSYAISVEETGSCPGDFDGNGFINVGDLLLLTSDFGCTAGCYASLDGNSTVNVIDLLIFSTLFGLPCP